MNKLKLVQIIVKDLEELKNLTEDVIESKKDSSMIIDLALNRARLICQEIELLREVSDQTASFNEETEVDSIDESDEDVPDESFPDPELEIINFEEPEFSGEEEDEEDTIVYDAEEEESDEDLEENYNDEDPIMKGVEEHLAEDEESTGNEDEDSEEFDESEEEFKNEEIIEEKNIEVEFPVKPETKIHELKTESQAGVREIQIEDMDEDDNEPIQFSAQANTTSRPVMHEIPKPENPVNEKIEAGETFQKERSLNDTIGEKKLNEPNLGSGAILNLRAAIGLNDRYLFIRDIFDNNADKYNMVIDQLDKLTTIQQAVEFLKANLSLQKNDTSLKFVELLKRRFSN